MEILSQQDPQWRSLKLGKSLLTIGRFGCTTTCISMLSDYYNCFKTPAELARTYIKYTVDGLLIWQSIDKPIFKFKFEKRLRVKDVEAINISLADPGKAVILEVNNSHWVVALKKLFGNVYWVADPWDGKKKINTKLITGSAHFTI